MQNLRKVLKTLACLERKVAKISEEDIEKIIPSDPEKAIEALQEIIRRISKVVRVLFRVREVAIEKRIEIERQAKDKQEKSSP